MTTPPRPTLEVEDRIVAAIRRLMRAVDLHSRRLVDEYGLTGPQLATLREVEREGLIAASVLARAVHLSGPTMTGILTRLEKRGLVQRARGEVDRRTVQVSLTEVGRRILEQAPSLLQDRFRDALSKLAEWEQLAMLASLQRIAEMMDAQELDASPHLVADAGAFDRDRAEDCADDPSLGEPPRGRVDRE